MKKMFKILAVVLIVFLIYPQVVFAEPEITIQHIPPTCIVSGHPYPLYAVIRAPQPVTDARLYFKIQGTASYYVVRMQPIQGSTYLGILPAATKSNMVVEYFLASHSAETRTAHSPEFYTFTSDPAECASVGLPEAAHPIVVYAERPMPAELGFSGETIQWETARAFDHPSILTEPDTKNTPVQETRAASPSEPENKRSALRLPQLSTKTIIGIGAGVGAAAVTALVLAGQQEESSIDWTLLPEDLDDDIEVEIIKTPQEQTTCGTIVTNSLYVKNRQSQSLTVTTIDYEIVLTREKPAGGCNAGRVGTFAPNWAVVVEPGEQALVRQWSNVVNPCSDCPYTSSDCRWNSKYVVHTTLGSGETETKFSTQGDLCAATTAGKVAASCTPPNADVEP